MERIVDRLAKWKLHRFYSTNPELARHLPPAALLTPASLAMYINRYGTVYVKANTIHTGKGIVKVWKARSGYNFIRVRGKVMHAPTAVDLVQQVKAIDRQELYIVQQAVDLAAVASRPYDIRVMMMRDGQRQWQFAGMVAKVHGPESIVSNIRRGGGYVLPVEDALRKSGFSNMEVRRITTELISLGKKIIRYSEHYPFYSFQSGIDLAVDKQGRIWIIEVNLHNPSHGLFKQLKNQRYYDRVKRLYQEYRKHNTRLI